MSKKQSGLTLVELVIGLSIMAVVLSGTVLLLNSALAAWQSGRARVEVEQTLRVGIDAIVRETRYAVSANVTQAGDGTLVLTLKNINEDTIDFKLNTNSKALTKRITNENGNDAGFQPITGNSTETDVRNIIIINNPDAENPAEQAMFTLQNKLVSVTITAMDTKTGVQATMHTKIFCVNI